MLSDRNYMSQSKNTGDAIGGIKMVFTIIAVNVAFFLFISPDTNLYHDMTLTSNGFRNMQFWTPLTAMFLHGGFSHLFLNMWGLYLFGTIIAPILGGKRFLTLYLISGFSGNLLWLLFNWSSSSGVVGASGALFGIMLATAMLYPDKEFMLIFLPVPMKTKTLVVVYAIVEIMSEFSAIDNIAHLAHLGGFIGGYIYIKFIFGNSTPWDLFGFLLPNKNPRDKIPHGWSFSGGSNDIQPDTSNDFEKHLDNTELKVSQAELDQILNKISFSGINSLSDAEMATLKKAREQMRRH